ncbi:MAG: hypothetical protein Q8Q08_02530 [Candidatus Omnitrophota bacterium]|nr:hypothetical protein [Candidatus Omnitrophota bacterium]MDZ4241731.1 hypothetical protein [Candidatus Omnitrophota bacterium]
MTTNVIFPQAKARIKEIHRLSRCYNQKVKISHQKRLLHLMRKHVAEIEELCRRKDKHAVVETGDLVILCFELILEHRASLDKILTRCFIRYDQKLSGLLADLPKSRRRSR